MFMETGDRQKPQAKSFMRAQMAADAGERGEGPKVEDMPDRRELERLAQRQGGLVEGGYEPDVEQEALEDFGLR